MERGSKIGAIDGCMTRRFGVVDILASGTKKFDGARIRNVVLAHRKERVSVTHDAGAFAEVTLFVLFKLMYQTECVSIYSCMVKVENVAFAYHFGETTCGDNIASVNQAIQMARRFLNLLAQVVVCIEVENIRHEVQRILIVRYFGVQAGKIETVGQVFLVDLTEVLISARRNEL